MYDPDDAKLMKKREGTLNEYMSEFERMMVDLNGGEEPVILHWDEIIGHDMSEHIILESADEREVVVRCAHPAFASWLRLNEREVLSRLRRLFPRFAGCRLKILS